MKGKSCRRGKAFFVTFEGLEGSGKSSVISSLNKYLKAKGFKVAVFREPGSTAVGEKIRKILLDKKNKRLSPHTELLLYLAARTQLIEQELVRALNKYDFIICDRFFDSTLVYQGYALGLGAVVKEAVKMFSLGIKPDLTIILDTDIKKCLDRLKSKDRIESRPFQFHYRLKKGFKALSREFPERIRLLSADKKLEYVCQDVKKIVDGLCRKKIKRL